MVVKQLCDLCLRIHPTARPSTRFEELSNPDCWMDSYAKAGWGAQKLNLCSRPLFGYGAACAIDAFPIRFRLAPGHPADVSELNFRDKIESCIVLTLKNRIVRMGDVFDGAMGMHSRHHLKTWLVKNFSLIDSPRIIQIQDFR